MYAWKMNVSKKGKQTDKKKKCFKLKPVVVGTMEKKIDGV